MKAYDGLSRGFCDPSAADDQIVLVKHHGLSRRDGALRLVERHAHLAVGSVLQHAGAGSWRWRIFGGNAHRRVRVSAGIMQAIDGDPVQVAGNQRA